MIVIICEVGEIEKQTLRQSLFCQQIRKVSELFQDNIPYSLIGRNLYLSCPMLQSKIKRLKKFGETGG